MLMKWLLSGAKALPTSTIHLKMEPLNSVVIAYINTPKLPTTLPIILDRYKWRFKWTLVTHPIASRASSVRVLRLLLLSSIDVSFCAIQSLNKVYGYCEELDSEIRKDSERCLANKIAPLPRMEGHGIYLDKFGLG
jgi:hypothetical protein